MLANDSYEAPLSFETTVTLISVVIDFKWLCKVGGLNNLIKTVKILQQFAKTLFYPVGGYYDAAVVEMNSYDVLFMFDVENITCKLAIHFKKNYWSC